MNNSSAYTKKSMRLQILVLLTLSSLLSACTSAKLDSYVSPGFAAGQVHRLAVMPIVNQRIDAGQAIELNRAFIQKLQRTNPDLVIVGGQDATTALNEHDLTESWTDFLRDYSTSGLPNTKTLVRISKALDVDAIVVGAMLQVKQEDSDGFTYPITQVSIRYTLFDATKGAVLWELTGEGKIRPYSYSAAPVFEAAKLAHEKILEKLPL